MRVFVRFSQSEIRIHSAVQNPDYVVCLDQNLSMSRFITDGATKKTQFILNVYNTKKLNNPTILELESPIYLVNANQVVMKYLPKPITNIAMLGALCKYLPDLPFKQLSEKVYNILIRKGEKVADDNVKMLKEAYDAIK